jgi:hypothetical protein
MRLSLLISLASLLSTGCATHKETFYGGYSRGEPVVTLESLTQAENSPARGAGYPYSLLLPAYPPEMARAGVTAE